MITLVRTELPAEAICKVLFFLVIEVEHLVFGPDIFNLGGFDDFIEILLSVRRQHSQAMADLRHAVRPRIAQKLEKPGQGAWKMAGTNREWAFRVENPPGKFFHHSRFGERHNFA